MRHRTGLFVVALCIGFSACMSQADKQETESEAGSVHDFEVKNIDGEAVSLSKYKGNVVLLVNVASRCGLTPQYQDLQALNEKYRDRGLRVLGFPANNFGAQEPGSNEEIKSFCSSKFSVTFDLFSKVSVLGDDCCPLYRFLTDTQANGKFGGDIKWNFTKFLVDADGKVIARFEPRLKPSEKEVTDAIEKALEKTPSS